MHTCSINLVLRRGLNSGVRAFSLVELLAVIAIMAILSALVVASTSLLRSNSLTASGNQMVDFFEMARQNSLTRNNYTAVVIKTQGAGACQAYCLLELSRNPDGTFGNWQALTPWKYLPTGVVFENTAATAANDTFLQTSNAANLPEPLPTSFTFQGQPLDLTGNSVAVQCFRSDGTLAGGQSLRLRVLEGTVDASGNLTYHGATVSGNEVSYYDLVFVANTGVTKIERP